MIVFRSVVLLSFGPYHLWGFFPLLYGIYRIPYSWGRWGFPRVWYTVLVPYFGRWLVINHGKGTVLYPIGYVSQQYGH